MCQNPLNPFDYSFTFWDFGVIPGCQDWWDCIGNLPGHEADRVIEAMSFQASLIIEQNYVSYWVNLINPNCPNSFLLPTSFVKVVLIGVFIQYYHRHIGLWSN